MSDPEPRGDAPGAAGGTNAAHGRPPLVAERDGNGAGCGGAGWDGSGCEERRGGARGAVACAGIHGVVWSSAGCGAGRAVRGYCSAGSRSLPAAHKCSWCGRAACRACRRHPAGVGRGAPHAARCCSRSGSASRSGGCAGAWLTEPSPSRAEGGGDGTHTYVQECARTSAGNSESLRWTAPAAAPLGSGHAAPAVTRGSALLRDVRFCSCASTLPQPPTRPSPSLWGAPTADPAVLPARPEAARRTAVWPHSPPWRAEQCSAERQLAQGCPKHGRVTPSGAASAEPAGRGMLRGCWRGARATAQPEPSAEPGSSIPSAR